MINVVLMLGAIACTDRTTPTSGSPASQLLTGSAPEPIEHPGERRFWDLARVAPSHGGWYFDRLTGDLNVYLKDMTEGPAAKRALPFMMSGGLARARAKHPHAGIVFKQGTYTFIELARWRDALDNDMIESNGVQLFGIDHAKNRILIGVLAGADSGAIVAKARELGVPEGALRFVRNAPIRSEKTLTDSIRPVEGGIILERVLTADPDSALDCTLGFLALWGGQHAFVTNSHCSTNRWALDSTKWYQNRAPFTHAESLSRTSIGYEVADASSSCHCQLGFCPCTTADAAVYIATLGPGDWYFKRIARPVLGCNPSCNPPVLTIDSTRPFWSIVRTQDTIDVGQIVNKIGQVTGWTQGFVLSINVKVNTDGGSYLDQAIADYGHKVGDSGAPVLQDILGGTDTTVTLAGIHWGATPDSDYAIFSPWSGILQKYPALRVK
ncbi:MAG TPA: hypothetical protein VGU74_00450 [Gemmatimonadales bacterium]|nr:hypothetical protein [Gemmatimonadales bacterium]